MRREASYALPRDAIRLRTNDPRVITLADRFWPAGKPAARTGRAPIALSVEVTTDEPAGPVPSAAEWAVGVDDVSCVLPGYLETRIECARGQMRARVSGLLLDTNVSLAAHLLLETPAAVLLARRSYAVVHAGVVTGPSGAVVIRGAPGAGKSTLVAAAHRAGLGILGDESVLVARDYPDELLAGVRDVTILPDTAELLAFTEPLQPAGKPGEAKLRLDLFEASHPEHRWARRVATVILGPRNGGPARLEPLAPGDFLAEFDRGQVAQELWSGTPASIASHWSTRGAYRLSGANDLPGAVNLLAEIVA